MHLHIGACSPRFLTSLHKTLGSSYFLDADKAGLLTYYELAHTPDAIKCHHAD